MVTVQGDFNSALCFCAELDEYSERQIKTVCNQAAFKDCKIRIMPDVHAGKGCTIGTTMTIIDKIVPGMVGVDIGCGMETVRLKECAVDFNTLDTLIREQIPCGREIRDTHHFFNNEIHLEELRCSNYVNLERARRSLGTLGGGNHFIEIDRSEDETLYLIVHSGSRHIGNEVAQYYQEEGFNALCGKARFQIEETIRDLKAKGRFQEIQKTVEGLKSITSIPSGLPSELAYVESRLFDDYIHDMKIIQHFAMLNRKAMAETLLNGMKLTKTEEFTTIHNYIDTDAMILRKGAVAANRDQKLLIPINMRDGCLICVGLGNEEWNCSAPHGAGRLMSRKTAFNTLSMDEYRREMRDIFTTCVSPETLDESPMAYKNMDEIIRQITPTAKIISRIRPIYNFKAAE